MDSTNLYGAGYIHGGMQPHPYRDLSTMRAIHNDMLVYHTNKIHVVKVPVVVQDQLLESIPVVRSRAASEYQAVRSRAASEYQAVHAFNDGLVLQAPYSGNVHSVRGLMQIINIY